MSNSLSRVPLQVKDQADQLQILNKQLTHAQSQQRQGQGQQQVEQAEHVCGVCSYYVCRVMFGPWMEYCVSSSLNSGEWAGGLRAEPTAPVQLHGVAKDTCIDPAQIPQASTTIYNGAM